MKRILAFGGFFVAFSAMSQNLDFAVYTYSLNTRDSSLHRLYRCKEDGGIVWEKFFHGPGITEECNYRYAAGRLVSKTCCFKRDSCFTWNFVYEDRNIILARVIASPAFPDSLNYKESVTYSYPDSVTTILFHERQGMNPTVRRVREVKKEEYTEVTGFDKDGKAVYTEQRKHDQFGLTESARETPGHPELLLRFRRFPVTRKR